MSTPQDTTAPPARNGRDGPPMVRLIDVGKRYGAVIALHDITMEVSSGAPVATCTRLPRVISARLTRPEIGAFT